MRLSVAALCRPRSGAPPRMASLRLGTGTRPWLTWLASTPRTTAQQPLVCHPSTPSMSGPTLPARSVRVSRCLLVLRSISFARRGGHFSFFIPKQVSVSPRNLLPLGTASGYRNTWGYGDNVVTLVEGVIYDDRQGNLWKVRVNL